MTRCPKCHRFHSIDIAIDELCKRLTEIEEISRRFVNDPQHLESHALELKSYFDRHR